jgi:maleylacetoacetate isomerase
MEEKKEVELFSYWRSSASWRVRWALDIKGVDYKYHPVNILKQEQHDPAYKEKNPLGTVPALKIDGVILGESVAIIEYLEETRPENPLFPKDPKIKAKVRQIVEIVNAGIHPIQNQRVIKKLGEERKEEWSKHFTTLGFQGNFLSIIHK